MITTEIYCSFFTGKMHKNFYRNGQVIGWANGQEVRRNPEVRTEDEISRAQAFRYWDRNFKGRYCWTLPELLQEALDKPSKTYGSYWNERLQEVVGYEG